MQDSKNLILAIVISTAILFSWQHFYAGPKVAEAQKQAELARKSQQQTTDIAPEIKIEQAPVIEDRSTIIKKTDRVIITTDKLHGSIAAKGLRFDDLTLAEYKETTAPDSKEVVLLSPSSTTNVYFAEFGWLAANHDTKVPTRDTTWHSDKKTLTSKEPVTFSWDNNEGLKFYVTISIDENYMFKISRKVENYGSKTASLLAYGTLSKGITDAHKPFYILHEGPLGVFNSTLDEITYEDLKDEKKREVKSAKGWFGITDKYWLTAIIPDKTNSFDTNFNYYYLNNRDRYQADYLGSKSDITPGQKMEATEYLYAGAKKLSLFDAYAKELNIDLFDHAVDFGRLYFITKPIFKLLTFFNHLLGNFGLAILLLTVAIKALMYPLANKSYTSMHHLKRLQPQLVALKEQYKNDKAGMNKAVMDLYKTEKVNPMAGCLPILVQIPIFFALYKVLFITIEMRQAPFYGWIKDLSMPDPTSIFNLFGLLPFTPPHILMIGAWPIIMGITMIIQQKMNPAPTDPVQAKVMQLLPFIFVVMFASFPAGLVLYWAWNNALSILQQWFITRRLPK
ncbi:MAG: rane protein insertase YidC [Rickettsiaceae bacterium]|jgi:YidC/Oxa1 family membrane protein insertase|nr:rane protein insertase YidC [Rickettsiaceae bacterium]